MVAKKTTRRGASTAEASAEKKEIPGWLWLGAGVAIGILITLLMNLNARRVAGGSAIQEVGQIVSRQPHAQSVHQTPTTATSPVGGQRPPDYEKIPPEANNAVPVSPPPPPCQSAKRVAGETTGV
jgi:hypothetical protein